jgi:hypothetical protein
VDDNAPCKVKLAENAFKKVHICKNIVMRTCIAARTCSAMLLSGAGSMPLEQIAVFKQQYLLGKEWRVRAQAHWFKLQSTEPAMRTLHTLAKCCFTHIVEKLMARTKCGVWLHRPTSS